MIPVTPQPEPKWPEYDFNHDVRERGEDTVRQLAGLAPKYGPWPGANITKKVNSVANVTKAMIRKYHRWTRAMPALHKAYDGICAYEARRIELIDTPTTDHFTPLDSDISKAHEWSNFRLASLHANGLKSDKDVLDPFLIKDGWFAIDLFTYETVVGPRAPSSKRAAILETIARLRLNKGLKEIRSRAARNYFDGRWVFSFLKEEHPFLANEIRRLGALLKTDR